MASDLLFEYAVVNGIHMLRLLQPHGKAVKALLDHAETHVVEKPINGKNLVLLDFCISGPPRVTEALPYVIGFFGRQPKRAPEIVRVAFVYPRSTHVRVLQGFLTFQRFLPHGILVKFFSESDYQKAVDWLHTLSS